MTVLWIQNLVAVAVAATPTPTTTATTSALFAIVVGNNHPLPGSQYAPLQYADDDAIRFAAYFESLGAQVFLSTGVDYDTAQRYPDRADRAHIPTRAHVLRLFNRVKQALQQADGIRRELFVYFSGHGSVSSSDAYLHLVDGPLSRTDLHELILRRMPAERIHAIIDSCHSYFLVNARGERVRVAEDEGSLDKYPHAGFLLSTSAKKEVQEWSGYQAGVFSYQVLGALQGAADMNRDGVVSYPEVHAYIVAANLGVRNPAARILPYVRRPSAPGDALLDLSRASMRRRVRVPPEIAGHFVVSDDRGIRVLDAHKARGEPMDLIAGVGRTLYLRIGDSVYETHARPGERRIFHRRPEPAAEALAVATKGSVADEFRQNLFSRPLTREFVAGLDAATGAGIKPLVQTRVRAPAWTSDPLTLGLLSTGVAGLIVGGVGAGLFIQDQQRFEARPVTPEHQDFRESAERWRAVMVGGLAAGGSLLTAGILRALLTNESSPESFALSATHSGLIVRGEF